MSYNNTIYIWFDNLSSDTQEEIIDMARQNVLREYEEWDEWDCDKDIYIEERVDEEIKNIDVVFRS
jgi:molybdopterin converting factor small subunit